jgi:hypothetical protein
MKVGEGDDERASPAHAREVGSLRISNPQGAAEAALAISAAEAAALSQELTDELRLVFHRPK